MKIQPYNENPKHEKAKQALHNLYEQKNKEENRKKMNTGYEMGNKFRELRNEMKELRNEVEKKISRIKIEIDIWKKGIILKENAVSKLKMRIDKVINKYNIDESPPVKKRRIYVEKEDVISVENENIKREEFM